MSQRDKRERAMRENVRAVRLADVLAVLEAAGFDCQSGRQGHWTCVHLGSGARCNVPTPHGAGEHFVKPTYVRAALEALDESRRAQ